MANRTFLELVNDVLVELREPAVGSVTADDYTKLIARFVNLSKRAVEDAWQWSTLRAPITVTTVAGTATYALPGSTDRTRVLGDPGDAWNKTQKWELNELRRGAHRALFNGDFTDTTGVATGPVYGYSVAEGLSSGLRQVHLYPVPTGVESLRFNTYNPPADWVTGAEECLIPYTAIVETAVALARGERGEDGGIAAGEQAAFAAKAASDAIALDAGLYSDDLTWEAV